MAPQTINSHMTPTVRICTAASQTTPRSEVPMAKTNPNVVKRWRSALVRNMSAVISPAKTVVVTRAIPVNRETIKMGARNPKAPEMLNKSTTNALRSAGRKNAWEQRILSRKLFSMLKYWSGS